MTKILYLLAQYLFDNFGYFADLDGNIKYLVYLTDKLSDNTHYSEMGHSAYQYFNFQYFVVV